MRRFAGYAVPLAALLAVSACTASPAPDPGEQRYRHTGMVMENEKHGPQLCASWDASYPPGCGGPDVVGWDWTKVTSESARGARWGEYTLVGTFDGERFTLTEPPKPAPKPPGDEPYRSSVPCEEPAGGWRPVDESNATRTAAGQAMNRARSAEDFAGAWLDHPDADGLDTDDPEAQRIMNDPRHQVLNLSFTGDLDGREEWIREVWGGALCISSGEHTLRELVTTVNGVGKQLDGFISAGLDVQANRVHLEVYLVTDELRRQLDAKYGEGVVHATSWLEPVE